jgi:Dienelactone hydrolase and related enzymes
MSNEPNLDPRIVKLYDEYCHGAIDRREFLRQSATLTVGGFSALGIAMAMLPEYGKAQTISFTDERIKARYVEYPSPGGSSGTMRGYLVQPRGDGPFPAVLVIHENRGLNPYIEDVARRVAVAGFLALAPDGLSPVGGYPGNDDDGREMQAKLDPAKLRQDMVNSAKYLKAHSLSNGKLGAVGFCWGGATVAFLAVTLGEELDAAVPFYGPAPAPENAAKVRAPLLVQLASNDERVNASWPPFEAALKEHKREYTIHTYENTNHGFHNNSTPRYNEAAAKLAWERTVEFFKARLGQ